MTLPAALEPLARAPAESAFVSDFDGTLSPIVDDYDAAVALDASLDALRALTARLGLVGVISGRPVEFLQRRVPVDGVMLVGQYGLERVVGGEIVVDSRALDQADAVEAARAEAEEEWPALRLERKGEIAFTLHWRTAREAPPNTDEFHALARRHGLVMLPGRMSCELRPPVDVDKGTAFRDLADPYEHAAFAGDDRGDLAAFGISFGVDRTKYPVCVGVRSPEAPPELLERADVVVDGPTGLTELLQELARAV